jgi:hypothetical protein
MGGRLLLFFGGLQLDDSTLWCERYSMGTIMSAKFGKYAAYMALHRFVRDGEFIGYQLVGISQRNQRQHLNFPWSQSVIGDVVSEFGRDFGMNTLFSGVDGPDRVLGRMSGLRSREAWQ